LRWRDGGTALASHVILALEASMRTLTCVGVLALVLALGTAAAAGTANFRRPEVIKLMKIDAYYCSVAHVKDVKGGMVVAAFEPKEKGTPFSYIFVPQDRNQPVRRIKNAELAGFGLRSIKEAFREAMNLGGESLFAGGKPYKKLRFQGITTHHNKHAGTSLSYLFTAVPTRTVEIAPREWSDPGERLRAAEVSFSVPIWKGQRRGKTAWPSDIKTLTSN
jgi:hypothetical protein